MDTNRLQADALTEERLLRLPQVVHATGLSKSTIYRLAQLGEFPCPVKLSKRASAWKSRSVLEFLRSRKSRQ